MAESVLSTSRAVSMIVLPIVFGVLSTIFVIARLVSRHLQKARYGLDDVLIVVALVRRFWLCDRMSTSLIMARSSSICKLFASSIVSILTEVLVGSN